MSRVLCALALLACPVAWGKPAAPGPLALADRTRAALAPRQKRQAIQSVGARELALRRCFLARHSTHYKVEVPGERLPHAVRNQEQSGRCWLMATDRVLATKVAARGGKPAPLSVSFVNYYSLQARARGLLDEAARTSGKLPWSKIGDLGEGGYFSWSIRFIRRHGIVPESVMPSGLEANHSELLKNSLKTLLASAYRDLERTHGAPGSAARRAVVQRYRGRIDALLDATLGKPPARFTVEGKSYTPRTYLRDALELRDADLDYVTLAHQSDAAWHRRITDKSETPGLPDPVCYNVSMAVIERAMRKTLRAGEGVYFATNVEAGNPFRALSKDRGLGIASLAAFDYAPYLPLPRLAKRERLRAGINAANHGMVITGCDPGPHGTVRKWKVDNSHGEKAAGLDHGHFHMYDDYFRQYVERVEVPRSSVPKKLLAALDARPVVGTVQKWTTAERRKVVVKLLDGASVEELAREHHLTPAVLASWKASALGAMNRALRATEAPRGRK